MSLRSMPVQNAFSPAAVSTAQLTSPLVRSDRQIVWSSRAIVALKALCTSGRSSVIQATPACSS